MMINDVPAHWSWVKLGDVVENAKDDIVDGPFGSNLKATEYQDSGVPIIRLQNIDRHLFVDKNIKFIKSSKAMELKRHNFKSGDIVLTKLGDPLGKACLVPSKYSNGIIVADIVRIRNLKKLIDKEFLIQSLNSDYVATQLKIKTKGTTRPRVNLSHVRNLELKLPPLPEQKKIVEKIEELFSGLDSGVASLKKTKKQLRLYRQSVLAFAFSGRLLGKDDIFQKENISSKDVIFSGKAAEPKVDYGNDSLPEGLPDEALAKAGWKWVKLGVATQLNPKLPFEEIDENILVSFLPMRQVEELTGKFDLSMEKKYSEVKKGFTPFTNGDVIFAKITPCMENGKIAIVNKLKNKIGFGSTEFHVFRVKNDLVNLYLFYFLIQDTFRAKAQHNMTGAVGQKRVPKRFLEESEIPLPPLDQQHKIVSEIEKRFSEADNLEKAIDESLVKSESLRQSILKQAFEGRLV